MTTYSIAQIEATTDTTVISLLSAGNSRVYYCHHLLPSPSNGLLCRAIKIYCREDSKKRVQRILSEKLILQRLTFLNNAYTSQLVNTAKDDKYLYFVMEAYHCGHLNLHITDSKYGRFTPSVARNYAAEIVSALLFLTKCGCVHRDIKPKNCLIDKNGHIKICDFGASKILFSEDEYGKVMNGGPAASPKTYTIIGTLQYMAPEIAAKTSGYSLQVDWWSFGLFMFEMLCGKLPPSKQSNGSWSCEESSVSNMKHLNQEAISNDILRTDLNFYDNRSLEVEHSDFWDSAIDSSFADIFSSSPLSLLGLELIKELLVPSPDHRWGPWTEGKIKKHPFFCTIDWESVDAGHSLRPDLEFNKNLGFLDLTVDEEETSYVKTEIVENLFKEFG